MAGQLIQRGERTWLIRVYLGRDEGGRRKYLNRTVHGSKKDAQRVLTALLRERDMGILVEPSRQTLNAYLDRWLETAAKPRVSARTLENYAWILDKYVRPALGARPLAQITPVEVQALYDDLQARGYAPATIRRTHNILHSAFGQAVKWRLLAQNPADYVDLPRQERPEMRALTPAEAERFLEAAKEDEHFPLFALLLATGLRPGEALALRWADLDLKRGTLHVQRALTGRDGRRRFEQPKTPRSRRTVPIPPSVVRILAEHRRRQAAQKLAAGPAYEDEGLVFATPDGRPLHYRNLVRRHFKPILRAAGLPETIRLYDLRHSCATLLLAACEHPKVVSERLGHASVTLTLDTYSHVLPDLQRAASEKLEALLFGGGRR